MAILDADDASTPAPGGPGRAGNRASRPRPDHDRRNFIVDGRGGRQASTHDNPFALEGQRAAISTAASSAAARRSRWPAARDRRLRREPEGRRGLGLLARLSSRAPGPDRSMSRCYNYVLARGKPDLRSRRETLGPGSPAREGEANQALEERGASHSSGRSAGGAARRFARRWLVAAGAAARRRWRSRSRGCA